MSETIDFTNFLPGLHVLLPTEVFSAPASPAAARTLRDICCLLLVHAHMQTRRHHAFGLTQWLIVLLYSSNFSLLYLCVCVYMLCCKCRGQSVCQFCGISSLFGALYGFQRLSPILHSNCLYLLSHLGGLQLPDLS